MAFDPNMQYLWSPPVLIHSADGQIAPMSFGANSVRGLLHRLIDKEGLPSWGRFAESVSGICGKLEIGLISRGKRRGAPDDSPNY